VRDPHATFCGSRGRATASGEGVNGVVLAALTLYLDRRVISTCATTPSQVRNKARASTHRFRSGITGEFKVRELKMVRPATAEPGAAPALA
jgi:hypothetical protein